MKHIYYREEARNLGLTRENCKLVELLNESFHEDISIAQAVVDPGETTERHYLSDTAEYYVLLSGKGVMYLDDREVGKIGAGDVVNIPANMRQSIKNIGEEELIFLCICSPRFRLKNYVPC